MPGCRCASHRSPPPRRSAARGSRRALAAPTAPARARAAGAARRRTRLWQPRSSERRIRPERTSCGVSPMTTAPPAASNRTRGPAPVRCGRSGPVVGPLRERAVVEEPAEPIVGELGRRPAPSVPGEQHRADRIRIARELARGSPERWGAPCPAADGARPGAGPRTPSPAGARPRRRDRRLPAYSRSSRRAIPKSGTPGGIERGEVRPHAGHLMQRLLPGENARPPGREQRAVDVPADHRISRAPVARSAATCSARLSASSRWARSTSSFWPHAGNLAHAETRASARGLAERRRGAPRASRPGRRARSGCRA